MNFTILTIPKIIPTSVLTGTLLHFEFNGMTDDGKPCKSKLNFRLRTCFDMKIIKNTGTNYNKTILVGDFTGWSGGTNGIGIARLNADGTIDDYFNSGPLATLTSNRGFTKEYETSFTAGTVWSIYIYPDGTTKAGKILIGGYFNAYNGFPANGLVLLNADGSYDTSSNFNDNINTIIDDSSINSIQGFNANVSAIIVQSNNKIVVGGSFNWYNGIPKKGILRLNEDGTLDTLYNNSTVYNGANPGFIENTMGYTYRKKFVLQPDGKLIVGGNFTKYNNSSCNNIVRINENGKFDSTFVVGTGFNNTTLNPSTSEPGIVRDLILDTTTSSNLLLYVSGDFTKYKGVACDEIIRIKCSVTPGTKDTNFNLSGGGTNGTNNGTVWCMKRQSGDGKIIIGGKFTTYGLLGTPALNVTRILPVNGSSTNEAKNGTIYYDSEPEIDVFTKDDVIIYPNPSTGIFNMVLNDSSSNFEIVIYDVMGRRIFEKKDLSNQNNSINLSEFNKGTYFALFQNTSSDKVIVKTIIIK